MSENLKKKRTLRLIISVFAIMTVCIVLLFFWSWYLGRYDGVALYPPGDVEAFFETSYYKINPNTILTALELGETNVFTPEIVTPETPTSAQPIEWHQSDFMKIASAMHQFVWHENVDGWNLFSMGFGTACNDNLTGFTSGAFSYFKTVPYDLLSNDYVTHGIKISSEYGEAVSGDRENFPQQLFNKWKSVDAKKIKISAEDALRIAEENGNKEARLSVQNKCKIEIGLTSDSSYWTMLVYKENSDTLIFSIQIDPYTGETIK